MAFENGVNWRPIAPEARGRHREFSGALEASLKDMRKLVERDHFFTTLTDNWDRLFPNLPARPGRSENDKIFIYVRNAPTLFMLRPKLPMIRKALSQLPGAPRKIDLHLEAHAS